MKRALYLPKGAYNQECNRIENIVGKYTGKVIACACACACVCVCVCVCIYIYIYIYICVCVCGGTWGSVFRRYFLVCGNVSRTGYVCINYVAMTGLPHKPPKRSVYTKRLTR